MRQKGRKITLLDMKEPGKFVALKDVLDTKMKERAKAGIGTKVKQAKIVRREDEEKLWQEGVLGGDTGISLLNAVFYKVGMHFALRGGKEHHDLKVSNFRIELSPQGEKTLFYTEDVSKSNQGGLLHMKIQQKSVGVKEDKSCPERCIVYLYERYMSCCPTPRPDSFYLQPIFRPSSSCLFSQQRVGVNKLNGMVASMMRCIGENEGYTNHSLRATAATRLYDAGHDNQAISSVTGHRSKAVEAYKRMSSDLENKIQNTIAHASNATFNNCAVSKKSGVEGMININGNNSCTFNINVNIH